MTRQESKLDYAIRVLTVENRDKYLTSGPESVGTSVLCLRPMESGYYMPCVARIVAATPTRVTVDLWKDQSKRVTVSRKAILWADDRMSICKAYDMLPMAERTLIKHRAEYPFIVTNDAGSPCVWRVVHEGVELGLVTYYKGRKLTCDARVA